MIAFKALLRTVEGKLVSSGAYAPYEVDYNTEDWIQHPNLFIFLSLEDAQKYSNGVNEIWKVEVEENDIRVAPREILETGYLESHYAYFWGNPEYFIVHFDPDLLQDTPIGSYNCNRLRLVERVREQYA